MIVRHAASAILIDVRHPEHPLWMVGVTARDGQLPQAVKVLNDMIAAWPVSPVTVEQVLAA